MNMENKRIKIKSDFFILIVALFPLGWKKFDPELVS